VHRSKSNDKPNTSKTDLRDHHSPKVDHSNTNTTSKGELKVLRLVDSRVQLAVTDGLATLRDFNLESRYDSVADDRSNNNNEVLC
jgi:hypothetical protein